MDMAGLEGLDGQKLNNVKPVKSVGLPCCMPAVRLARRRAQTLRNYNSDICCHMYRVVRKAQQLFAYPVSDKTVPNKAEMCNFFSNADVNTTAVMVFSAENFRAPLYTSCKRAVEVLGTVRKFTPCGSTGVIRDSSGGICVKGVSVLAPWSNCVLTSWCEWCGVTDIDQRSCPTMVKTGTNVTLENARLLDKVVNIPVVQQ